MSEIGKGYGVRLDSLGFRIKKARWQRMIKQKDLAKKLGCRPSHLSEIETGKKYPSIEMLWEIENHLGNVWKHDL